MKVNDDLYISLLPWKLSSMCWLWTGLIPTPTWKDDAYSLVFVYVSSDYFILFHACTASKVRNSRWVQNRRPTCRHRGNGFSQSLIDTLPSLWTEEQQSTLANAGGFLMGTNAMNIHVPMSQRLCWTCEFYIQFTSILQNGWHTNTYMLHGIYWGIYKEFHW